MTMIRRLLIITLLITPYFAFLFLIGPVSLWLLFNAVTWVGVAFAWLGLISIMLIPTVSLAYFVSSARPVVQRVAVSLIALLFGLSVFAIINTPSGQPSASSPIQHQFTQNTTFPRYRLANIVPEIEQFNLGFLLMPAIDPILTNSQAKQLAGLTIDIYEEMEADPDFQALGSVMGWAYAELFAQTYDVGHYYLYIPKNRPDTPLPAIVFLHGSGGNFKGYMWLMAQLAEAEGVVIIAPSYGFGNWRPAEQSMGAALSALDHASTQVDLDSERIYAMGLSNGGIVTSQLGKNHADRFRGLIYLSPVMPTRLVDVDPFLTHWRQRPILLITGETDRRIPIEFIQNRITVLENNEVDLTKIIYPNEDHFLFFSQVDAVLADIQAWLKRNP